MHNGTTGKMHLYVYVMVSALLEEHELLGRKSARCLCDALMSMRFPGSSSVFLLLDDDNVYF